MGSGRANDRMRRKSICKCKATFELLTEISREVETTATDSLLESRLRRT